MKKRGNTKTAAKPKKPSHPTWEQVRRMPVALFHSAGGPPIIGHIGAMTKRGVVVWAPAHVTLVGPTTVAYLPVPFVDKYIELLWSGIRGTNPIDPIIVQGYQGFFEQFIVDAYRMKPLMMAAGVDTPEGAQTQELPEVEQPKALEPCPACEQPLSAWNAHHPVKVLGVGSERKWICEVGTPNIRELYPDASPERPLDN